MNASRLSLKDWVVLLGVLLVALSPGFFTIPVMDRDEARYSQAAVQMMETGDYIDIRFQEQPRHVKPAGFYWLEVAATQAFGGPDAPIWAFRLPSLIATILAALVTAWLGARMAGPRAGLAAGTLLGVCLLSAIEARTAKTDAVLLFCAVVAQTALYFVLVRGASRFIGWPLVFWAATGAALLVKGPIVTIVSAGTILLYVFWSREWGALKRLCWLRGLLVAAAVALPWLIAITIVTDGHFLEQSVGHALLGKVAVSDDSHAGPFGYHSLLLPVTFWPGTLLFGLAGWVAWTRRREADIRFLLSWIVPTWIVFEAIATKLPHYVLPAFPAIAILCGMGFAAAPELLSAKGPRRAQWVSVALFVLVALVLAALVPAARSELGANPVSLAGIVAAILALGAAVMGARAGLSLTGRRVAAAGVLVLGVYWTVFEVAIPRIAPLWPSAHVARIVGALEGCETVAAATAGYREPSNVFYLGTETILGDGEDAAQLLRDAPACSVAVVEARELAAFKGALGGQPVRRLGTVKGTNTVKGRALTLGIFVAADSPLALPRAAAE